VLFVVSYILITGYSILLFMNPLNFKFLQLCQRCFCFKIKKRLENKKNVKNVTKLKT